MRSMGDNLVTGVLSHVLTHPRPMNVHEPVEPLISAPTYMYVHEPIPELKAVKDIDHGKHD